MARTPVTKTKFPNVFMFFEFRKGTVESSVEGNLVNRPNDEGRILKRENNSIEAIENKPAGRRSNVSRTDPSPLWCSTPIRDGKYKNLTSPVF
jgi:hypothetical protein